MPEFIFGALAVVFIVSLVFIIRRYTIRRTTLITAIGICFAISVLFGISLGAGVVYMAIPKITHYMDYKMNTDDQYQKIRELEKHHNTLKTLCKKLDEERFTISINYIPIFDRYHTSYCRRLN